MRSVQISETQAKPRVSVIPFRRNNRHHQKIKNPCNPSASEQKIRVLIIHSYPREITAAVRGIVFRFIRHGSFCLGWGRISRIFLYNFLPEVVGFALTLGFASCLQDRTDKKPVHTFAVPGMSQPYARGSQKIRGIRTNPRDAGEAARQCNPLPKK